MEIKLYPITHVEGSATEDVVEAFRKQLPVYGEKIVPGGYEQWHEENKPDVRAYLERVNTIKPDNISHVIESVELEGTSLTVGIRMIEPLKEVPEFGLRGFCTNVLSNGVPVLKIERIITFDLLIK